jgi:hypothetical protein
MVENWGVLVEGGGWRVEGVWMVVPEALHVREGFRGSVFRRKTLGPDWTTSSGAIPPPRRVMARSAWQDMVFCWSCPWPWPRPPVTVSGSLYPFELRR